MSDFIAAGFPHLYTCGPMSGYPEHNFPEFNRVSEELRAVGFPVHNPAECFGGITHQHLTRAMHMRVDIQLVLCSQGLALLDKWEFSRGAKLEVEIADQLGIPTHPWREWIKLAKYGSPAIHGWQ